MQKTKLKVELRNETGKGANKKFRREGIIPGVLYSPHDSSNLLLKVKSDELTKFLTHEKHALLNLEINEGDKKSTRLAMVKDFQYNSLKKQIVHIDFYGVTLKEKLTMKVNVELTGESIGVKDGGIMEFELRQIEVECLPTNVPSVFTVDITDLKIGDHYSVGDIEAPKGVVLLTEQDRVVVSVKHPSKEEVVVEEEEGMEEVEEKTDTEKPSSENK